MLSATQAIVLSLKRHSDHASLATLYTASHGRLTFLVYGKQWRPVLTPLALVEITANFPSTDKPASIKAVSLLYTPQLIPRDNLRQCVALFLSEILQLTLRHPMQDNDLFTWLWQQIIALDTEPDISNHHIRFLQQYTYLLGIGIDPQQQPQLLLLPDSRTSRQQQLRQLCNYYREHIDDFPMPKSLEILTTVFDR